MTDHYKKLSEENGASSVLIIFMMLVLITLGALAIASANVNYKLSRRTLEWNAMYYDLDGKGEEFLYALDGKLAEAEMNALDYVESGGYQYAEHPGVTREVQAGIHALYSETGSVNKEVFDRIYMYYAGTLVNELSLDFTSLQMYSMNDGAFTDQIYAEIRLLSDLPGHELSGLNVSVSLLPPDYGESGAEGAPLLVRAGGTKRYTIDDWYEYQDAVNEGSSEELWDGSLLK